MCKYELTLAAYPAAHAGAHVVLAVLVTVVVQGRQDAERAVAQRDHGTNKRKVRAPVWTGVLTFAVWNGRTIRIFFISVQLFRIWKHGSQNFYIKMVDYLKKALIYGHTSRISS